jgi:hypothetical protein
MRLAARAAPALLLGALLLGRAPLAADEPPLPGRLAGLELDAETCARWDARIADLAAVGHPGDAARLRATRVALRLGGLPALARLAHALRSGTTDDHLAGQLLRVVAALEEPEAQALLVEAARARSGGLRALAADGLAHDGAPAGLAVLLELAQDPLPGVRAVAHRALFVREAPEAVAARCALPFDPDPTLEARRLTLHRLRGDAAPELQPLAAHLWRAGPTPALRLAAARLLATPGLVTPTPLLLEIVGETGWGPAAAVARRWAAGEALSGYDPLEERRVAVETSLALLQRADLDREARRALIDRCVEWVAHPTPMNPREPDPIPEHALRRRLPELGAEVVGALERRFEAGGFSAPREGTMLLAELDADQALPLLARLLDRSRSQPVRAAASGALRMLGRLASEAQARLLVEPAEEASIRRDAIGALAAETAPWALGLLGGLLDATSSDTVESALDALEERGEPEARSLYEAYVLAGRCPEHRVHTRLSRLLVRWNDDARGTWRSALKSEHAELRAAALALAARFPLPQLSEVLPDLAAYQPRLSGAKEVEAWLGALARAAAPEALAYIRARWPDFPVGASLESTRCRALAALDVVRDAAHGPAAVDLVLEKAGGASEPTLLAHALEALGGRRGHRDAEIDAWFARLLEGRGVDGGTTKQADVAASVVDALQRPGRGDLTRLLLPLLDRLAPDVSSRTAAWPCCARWPTSPGPRRTAVLLALDPTVPTAVRASAGWLLAGRVGSVSRERLAAALLDSRQGASEPEVLLALAAAAGRGGGPDLAERFVSALEQELAAFHGGEAPPDPFAQRLDALPVRVQALAAAAAHAGTGPLLDRLARLLVDARHAPWAERVLHLRALDSAAPDPLAALAPAGDPRRGRLETGEEQASVLPPEVAQIALGLKAVGDEALAQALTRVLAEEQALSRFAAFPDAWPAKLALLLHDPRTGDLARAAAVLEQAVATLEPVGGPFDLAVQLDAATRAAERGAFDEAARTAHAARSLLARRGEELHGAAVRAWMRLRALELAWGAAALTAPDQEGLARARLDAAFALAGDDDATLLAELARVTARAGLDPERAEAQARRALALERRADGEESLERTAALAEVLLRRGRPGAAARRLGNALGRLTRPEHGRLHLWHARALCDHGDQAGALAALRRALLIESTLAEGLATDPWLAPLVESGALTTLLADVEAARRAGEEE